MANNLIKNAHKKLNTKSKLTKTGFSAKISKSKFASSNHKTRSNTSLKREDMILAEDIKTVFCKEDWINFFNAIENPPPPTERMLRAKQKYKEIIANEI